MRMNIFSMYATLSLFLSMCSVCSLIYTHTVSFVRMAGLLFALALTLSLSRPSVGLAWLQKDVQLGESVQ